MAQASAETDDSYIVVFRDDVKNIDSHAQAVASAHAGQVHRTLHNALHGFAANRTVVLTVTDNTGKTSSTTKTVLIP